MNNLIQFIGRRIVFFRRIQGISQTELADEVSVEKEDLEAIEKGKKEPSVTKIYQISQFLRARIEDFFPRKEEVNDIIPLYRKLARPNQEKIFHYARHLLRSQTKVVSLKNFKNKTTEEQNSKIIPIPIESDFVFLVDDASMEELIPKGSPVFCRRQPKVNDGEIAILEVFRLGTICRRVVYDFEEEMIILKALNPEFSDMTYERDLVKVIGAVMNVSL